MKHSPPASRWTPAQWLCLLIVAALAAAGWVQAAKWKQQASELLAAPQNAASAAASPIEKTSAGLTLPASPPSAVGDSPTVSLMEEVDLMRQIDLLNQENQRLSEALKTAREQPSAADEKATRDRAAIDGTLDGSALR